MKRIVDWINSHKIITICIALFLFVVQPIVVHCMFKTQAATPFWENTWGAGDLLGYIAGFEAFIGTVFLGVVAIRQNDKANDLNERMLSAEEKRDLFERQPNINISNCSCEVVAELDLSKKFSRNISIIYSQQRPITMKPDDNFNQKIVCFSFDLENLSVHPFLFSLSKVYSQNLSKNTPTNEMPFSLRYCDCNTSCRLLPEQKQNLVFFANEGSIVDKEIYAMNLSLIFTNLMALRQ